MECYASSRKEWRDWLRKNHKKERKVYLICYKKHTGKPSISHREALEEAICFGWIDTTMKRIDDEKYGRTFVKRNENSRWSNATLGYAKNLIKEGKMLEDGLKAYKKGLEKPTIDHNLPKNPDVPEGLKMALEKDKIAKKNFENFAPSYRKFYIYSILRAKRQETKDKRIKIVVDRSRKNKKPSDP